MSMFLQENLQIAYIEVQETNGKYFLQVLSVKNFDHNLRTVFLRKNFWIAHIKVQERDGKLFF